MKFWPDLSVYEHEAKVGSCKHGNKLSGVTKTGEILD